MVTPLMGRRKRSPIPPPPADYDEDCCGSPVSSKRKQALYPSFKRNSSIVQDLDRLERIQAMWGNMSSRMLPTISAEEDLIDEDVDDDLVLNFMYVPPSRRGGDSSASSSTR